MSVRRWTPLLWNTILLHVSCKAHGSKVQLLRDWLLLSNDKHESIFCSFTLSWTFSALDPHIGIADCFLPPQCHSILKNVNNHFPILTLVVRPPKGFPPSANFSFSGPSDMNLSAPKLPYVDLSGYIFSTMMLPLIVAECLKAFKP